MASIQPFIYRSEGNQNWEVHIPMEAPTVKMNTSYFGKEMTALILSMDCILYVKATIRLHST